MADLLDNLYWIRVGMVRGAGVILAPAPFSDPTFSLRFLSTNRTDANTRDHP